MFASQEQIKEDCLLGECVAHLLGRCILRRIILFGQEEAGDLHLHGTAVGNIAVTSCLGRGALDFGSRFTCVVYRREPFSLRLVEANCPTRPKTDNVCPKALRHCWLPRMFSRHWCFASLEVPGQPNPRSWWEEADAVDRQLLPTQ